MNNKIRRSIAALCAMAAVCAPLGTAPVFSDIIAPITASAADTVSSGTDYSSIRIDRTEAGYSLYFAVTDERNYEVTVMGCKTYKDNVIVTIPDTVKSGAIDFKITSIANEAFAGQDRIVQVDTPKYLRTIGSGAFRNCTKLYYFSPKALTPGYGDYQLTTIGSYAFFRCESLGSTSFLTNVTDIGSTAFRGCRTINSVYAPNLRTMGRKAFAECSTLSTVDLSQSSLTEIPVQAFQYAGPGMNGLMEVKLPSTVTSIGREAFYNVNGLRKIYLENVSTIGDSAFENCHRLQAVLTTEALTSIGSKAFCGCDPMKYFVCKNDNVSIGNQALGYDSMRNYQGKKQNFTLWGNSASTSVKRYADANGMTYRNTSEAAALATERYKAYEWAQPNVASFWGSYGKYYFNDAHRRYANHYGQDFNGICAGMAAVSALTSSGYLSVSEYAPGYDKISDVKFNGLYIPSHTKSYVTTVWSNSSLSEYYDYSSAGQKFGKEMLLYAENITYGADAAVFATDTHAMVCFGMEFRKDAADKNDPCWNGWDARLMIYDVNNTVYLGAAHRKGDYVYVRFSDGACSHNFPATYEPNGFRMMFTPEKMVSRVDVSTFFPAIRVQS